MSIFRLVFLIFVLGSSVFGNDAVRITPPNPEVSGSFLKPYENQWKFGFTTPDGKTTEIGTWSDQVEFIEQNGRRLMKRTQIARYATKNVEVRTENIFDPFTMLPLSMDWQLDKNNFNHRKFEGKKVQGELLRTPPGGSPKKLDVTFDSSVFDFNGGMYGLLLASFPLKEGYRATFPAIGEFDEDLHWVTFHVTGQEMTDAGSGKSIKAWVVVTEEKPEMTFWLTKEAPYVIKLLYTDDQDRHWFFLMS